MERRGSTSELLMLGIEVPNQRWQGTRPSGRDHPLRGGDLSCAITPLGSFLSICSRLELFIKVTNTPTGEWIAEEVIDAFPSDEASRHLIRNRDGTFGSEFTRRIRAMGIRDHPIARRSPWQNGHVERLIGSIRRESLDYLMVFGDGHLPEVLKNYASYYNKVRPHLSLDKDAPDFRRGRSSAASQRFQSSAGCIINMSG